MLGDGERGRERGDRDRGDKRWRKKGRGERQKEGEGEETQFASLNRPTELSSC